MKIKGCELEGVSRFQWDPKEVATLKFIAESQKEKISFQPLILRRQLLVSHLGKLYHGHQRLGWLFQPTCNMFSPIRSAIGTFPQVEVKKHDLKPALRLGEEANYHITTTIHYLLDSFESVMSKMTSTNEILHSEVLGFSLEVALQKFTGTTGTQASYSKLYNRSLCDMCVCFKKWKEKHVIYISYQSHWASLNIP